MCDIGEFVAARGVWVWEGREKVVVVVVVVGRFVELKSPVTCNKYHPLVDHYST